MELNSNLPLVEEIWKPISGYEGLYEVSTFGRVKTLGRFIIRKNGQPMTFPAKIMSVKPNVSLGYPQVNLFKEGHALKLVHRLVAEAFIPNLNPSELTHVDHIDGNRVNNNVSNLQWVTHKENITRAFRLGHVVRSISPKDVRLIRAMDGLFTTKEMAKTFSVE